MPTPIEIISYSDFYRFQVLDVWERSVRATHDFLSIADFEEIKALVQTINFNDFGVYCLVDGNKVLGFIGVAGNKVEMLFLDPAYLRKGWGTRLMHFAMHDLLATEVDVNEQNIHAVAFYLQLGFAPYERTDKDDQGKPYPLLRMRLKGA